MLFDELGIYGWDVVEPLVLAAIVADLPLLLIGDIGTNKTEGSKTIAQAVLGPASQFRHYEVPTLNFDDLVGFLNPKGLAKGTLEFVPTPLSIWKAEAALFDELNRANPFIQSKLHELIRTRHLMGLPTKLKLVFAAVNPPQTYQAGYMDLALASRFVAVQVPNLKSMKDAHLDRILGKNGQPAEGQPQDPSRGGSRDGGPAEGQAKCPKLGKEGRPGPGPDRHRLQPPAADDDGPAAGGGARLADGDRQPGLFRPGGEHRLRRSRYPRNPGDRPVEGQQRHGSRSHSDGGRAGLPSGTR